MRYSCDFETTTEPFFNKYGYTRVWGACAINIDNTDERYIFNDIAEFINHFKYDDELYFHNLKFDGNFIISHLLNNGWQYDEKLKADNTFKTTINDMGIWYSITMCFKSYKSKKKKITIYDSLKKLPFKVSQLSKAFNIEETKLVIDYDIERGEGYIMNDLERDYIVNDCLIVAKALKEQFNKDLSKMTIGSDAMAYFKDDIGKRGFDYLFPVLTLEVDNYMRKSYKGGWTYCNPLHADKRYKGVSYDVNSLYPSVMYGNNGLLPYGKPVYYKGEYKANNKYPLYIQRVMVIFDIKKDHLPTMQIKSNPRFIATDYLEHSDGVVELTLTKPDLELLFEHYNIGYIEYIDGYMFKGSATLFRDYIDYWIAEKINNTGAKKTLAKLMLNNLYGKFATNPKVVNKIPYLDEEGIVSFKVSETSYKDPVYTPLGAFITAYARRQTIETAQQVYDRFIYADTDSIHLIGEQEPTNINIDDNLLGYWKCEGVFDDSKFIRAKTYIKWKKGHIDITCAGMPQNVKDEIGKLNKEEAFNRFKVGSTFSGKLLPKRVKGGVILIDTEFTIK